MPKNNHDAAEPARLNIRLNRTAYLRLAHACKLRAPLDIGQVPYGRILTELIMAHLPAAPGEEAKPRRKKSAA